MNQKEKLEVTIHGRDPRVHRVSLSMITGNFNLYTFIFYLVTFIFPLCVFGVLCGEI